MNRDYGKKHTTAVKKMADGGFMGGLAKGMAAGNKMRENAAEEAPADGESLGAKIKDGASKFWDRLTAGNIDDPNSRAYREFGAGREQSIASSDERQLKRMEAAKAENDAVTPEKTAKNMAADTEFGDMDGAVAKAQERASTDMLNKAIDDSLAPEAPAKAAGKSAGPARAASGRSSADPRRVDQANQTAATAMRTGVDLNSQGRGSMGAKASASYETPYERHTRQARAEEGARRARMNANTAGVSGSYDAMGNPIGMKSGGMVKGYADGGKVEGRMYGKKC